MTWKDFLADGGMKSRKLWLGVGCLVALSGMVFAAAHWAAIAGVFAEYVGGVLGVYSVFCGVNVANRWGSAKHLGDKLAEPAPDADAPAEK
jgi:hypothetical protein